MLTSRLWTKVKQELKGLYFHVKKKRGDFMVSVQGYPEMGYYLNKTGRPMVYSCSWPAYQVFAKINPNYTAIAESCNLWRNYDDIDDEWNSINTIVNW